MSPSINTAKQDADIANGRHGWHGLMCWSLPTLGEEEEHLRYQGHGEVD